MQPIDPATTPFLSGRFAPVHDELDVGDLPVEGELPAELVGAYVRNGPNPVFPPLGSYTYPLEGDGMLHGVWLEAGRARYRNRVVRTQGLLAEERAGHALFGGIMTPAYVDQSLLGDDPDPGWPFKLDAFVNVIHHGGRYLALEEGTPPYEVTADLDTIGRFDWAGALPAGICAHPKVDPGTGELIAFRYDVTEPYLTWQVVGADGTVIRPATPVPGVDHGYMVHDAALTERYLVLLLNPLLFDLDAMMAGGPPLVWRPELGCRVALVPRDGGPVRWADGDAFWCWHVANAFDDGDLVCIDVPYSAAPALVVPGAAQPGSPGGLARVTVDPASGSLSTHWFDDGGRGFEFPRVDDRRTGRRHRYVVLAGRSKDGRLQPGEHDELWRYDLAADARVVAAPGAAIGEAVFAPRPGGTDELDGWYLAIGTDLGSGESSLLVWEADGFPADPRARIRLPRRVPNGLHGNWFAAS